MLRGGGQPRRPHAARPRPGCDRGPRGASGEGPRAHHARLRRRARRPPARGSRSRLRRAAGARRRAPSWRTSVGRPLQRLARRPAPPSPPCARLRPPGRPSRARRVRALRWSARVRRSPLRRRRGVEAEQDHARRLAGAQAAPDVAGAARALEARDGQLADLLAQAEAIDGLPRLVPAPGVAARPASPSPPLAPRARAPPRAPAPPRRASSASRRRAAGSLDSRTLGGEACGRRSLLLEAGPAAAFGQRASPNAVDGAERARALQRRPRRRCCAPQARMRPGERVAVDARSVHLGPARVPAES